MSEKQTPKSDAELVSAVLVRQSDAEEAFFKRVWNSVNCHAHSWGIRAADIEDLAAETVEKALRKLHLFRVGRAKLDTWIFVLARNLAYDRLRRDKNDPLRQESLELQEWMQFADPGQQQDGDQDIVLGAEIFDRLEKALNQLDPDERDLLMLLIDARETAAQIGVRMNLTAGQIRVRKHRLLNRLRDLLAA